MTQPTQTCHPWRATVRTLFAAGVALASLLPVIALTAHVDTVTGVAQVLAVAGAVTRVMAIPGVNELLLRFVPWLAAEPKQSTPAPGTVQAGADGTVAGHQPT